MRRIEVKCDGDGCLSEYFGPGKSIKEKGWSLGKKDYCPACASKISGALKRASEEIARRERRKRAEASTSKIDVWKTTSILNGDW